MKKYGVNELREMYLSFFESKGHLRLPSFALIPRNDPSLLMINAGMSPMKTWFTGEEEPPRRRVTTCQKCIRTPDIERVGKTARHGTYFEMLGNFSFGDYFKHEATAWAWEFCTQVLELPIDRIYISIYQDDDQAFDIWTTEVGVAADHIVRLGKEDNFWEHGAGPCGPCSELYFDRGEKYGCGSPDCAVGCECDRFVEFWNLVFTQFDNDGNGNYSPLAKPNIDTGMGLERLACIMQDVGNLFEVDTVQKIMQHASRIAGVKYGDDAKTDVSLRVITDHIRSTTFMLGDGVMPSNEGRGYVLRRLLRRAARHGRLLNINRPFLHEICTTVMEENRSAYPELEDKKDYIQKIILTEEQAFGKTIDSGLALLDEMLKNLEGNTLSGADAFKLYDTYGFPVDLTKDILEEKGLGVDEDAFAALMKEQRERARNSRKDAGADAWKGDASAAEKMSETAFVGYETTKTVATVAAILCGNETVDRIEAGDAATIVLDTTAFYAESGGQVGDTGVITGDGATFTVTSTKKTANKVVLHHGELTGGTLSVGDQVTATVDKTLRADIMRNHTAAHLLQAALRQVLGTHVEQAGQLVDSARMRFDFTHFSALTAEELAKVETLVNEWILADIDTDVREMPIDEARSMGAMALFGEKYGAVVRVVKVPDVSIELCGGTHAARTGQLGLFRIVSESSVAAGVRRIEAVTGRNTIALMDEKQALLSQAATAMKASSVEDVVRRAAQLVGEVKTLQQELDQIKQKQAAEKTGDLLANPTAVGAVRVVTARLENTDAATLRTIGDRCKDQAAPDMVILLAGINGDAASLCCCCMADAVKAGAHAGNIVRETAKRCGGNGGGRPDSAMAGAKDVSAVDAALAAVTEIVGGMLK